MEDSNRGARNMAFQGYHSSRSRVGKSTSREIAIPLVNQSNVVLKLCRTTCGMKGAARAMQKDAARIFGRHISNVGVAGKDWDLLLSFNFLDDDRGGSSTRKCFPAGGDFLAGEWKQLVVLAAGWSGVSDGPVDRAVIRQNDQWRAGLGACCSAFGADRFLQAFGECAGRIQNIAVYSGRFSGVAAPGQRAGDYCQDQGQHQPVASAHVIILRGNIAAPYAARVGRDNNSKLL